MTWNPVDGPDIQWITLSSQQSPGVLEFLTDPDSPRKWDQANGMGLSGSFVRYTGNGLSEFSCAFHLYTSKDFSDWETFEPLVRSAPVGTLPKAMDIWHPELEKLGIKSVVVKNLHALKRVDETGDYYRVVDFLQYRKPRVQYSKPDGSKSSEKDPVEQRIAGLTNALNLQQLSAGNKPFW